ncbi:MAG TPA: excisionase family DNA-binding protein [Nitriliruptorales bacterium]
MVLNRVADSPPYDALRLLDRLLEDLDEIDEAGYDELDQLPAVMGQVLRHAQTRATIHALFHALASGRDVHVTAAGHDLTPAEAAERLGISRKLVNKMLDAGEMDFYRLPQSSHKRIPATEVIRVLRERERVRAGVDAIMDAVAEADY